MYFGPASPKAWFDPVKPTGGQGEHVMFPPNRKDGHGLFTAAPGVCRPKVMECLGAIGYSQAEEKLCSMFDSHQVAIKTVANGAIWIGASA